MERAGPETTVKRLASITHQFLRTAPRAPIPAHCDPSLFWIDVHGTSGERLWKIVRQIEREVGFRSVWKSEALQTCTARGGCLHLDVIIQRLCEVARVSLLVGILKSEKTQTLPEEITSRPCYSCDSEGDHPVSQRKCRSPLGIKGA